MRFARPKNVISTACRALLVSTAIAMAAPTLSLAKEKADDARARTLFDRGVELYNEGAFEEAALAFTEAMQVKPSWKLYFNIGQSEAAAGKYGLALEALQKYLVEGKDEVPTDRKDYVLEEIGRVKGLVGDLEVAAPDGTEIYVDGVLRGTTPLLKPILVEGNLEHEISAVFKSGEEKKKRFSVWCQKSVKISFDKKDERAAGPPVQRAVAEEPATQEEGEPDDAQTSSTDDGKKGRALVVWGWTNVGLGGALLIAGAITGGMALSMDDYILDKCPDGECQPPYHDDVDKRDNLALATNVLLPVGGAVALAGATLLIVDAVKKNEEPADTVSFRFMPSFGGVSIIGNF